MKRLAGQTALVTGAASGIGLALARNLCREGMQVALVDVAEEGLDRAVTELVDAGYRAHGFRCDVADERQVGDLRAAVRERFGEVHLLCNNAGIVGGGGEVWELESEQWASLLGVNLWGVIHALRAFVPEMLAGGKEGHVLNTASVAGLCTGDGAYGVTKHAVVALSETLYRSLKAKGAPLGVSVLIPGLTDTGIIAKDDPSPFADRWLAGAAEGHFQDPELVALKAIDCIRKERFWVIPNERYREPAVRRVTDAFEGINPRLQAEALPGFPGPGW